MTGKRGGELSYRVTSPPTTFNYLLASDENSLIVSFYLMGGRLVEFDHKTLRYVPSLAESWQVGSDGKTIEITMRDGIKFSDGHPITAEDVAFTMRAIYDKGTASYIFRDAMMIGGRPIEISVPDAKDTRRLKLVFPEVVAAPENYLSNLAVLPRHILESDFNRGALREAYGLTADTSRVVTAGAFSVESSAPGELITLKRNPYYWKKDEKGAPLPYLDRLLIEVVKDANNALTRLQQGSLDIYDRIRPSDFAELSSKPGVTKALDLGPGLQTDYLGFNLNEGEAGAKALVDPVKRAWFNDRRFRQALSHAIDRQTIASITLQGLATPLNGFVSPFNRDWAATDLPRPAYDMEKARSLLREAGFVTRGSQDRPELYDAKANRVEFTLIVPSSNQSRRDMAIVAQDDLSRLGISMQVAPIESGEFRRRTSESFDYDAALLLASVSEPDPASYSNFLRSGSPSRPWRTKQQRPANEWEARVDDLVVNQARETDRERRRAAFNEIQKILAEQLPIIPIVARHAPVAVNQRVGNHRPSAILPYSLWNADELFVR